MAVAFGTIPGMTSEGHVIMFHVLAFGDLLQLMGHDVAYVNMRKPFPTPMP